MMRHALTPTYKRCYNLKPLTSCRQIKSIDLEANTLDSETHSNFNPSLHIETPQAKTSLTTKSFKLKHKRTVLYSSRSPRPAMKHEEARRLYEILKESELLESGLVGSEHQTFEEERSEAAQCAKQVHHKETNTAEMSPKLRRSIEKQPEASFRETSYPVPRALRSVKKPNSPPSMKKSRLQTFLSRFDKRKGTQLTFKKERLRGTTATTPKQKMFLVTLQRKKQQLKDYIGPPLTSTLSVKSLHIAKIDVSMRGSPTAAELRLLTALTPHYRH
jgi:hypothetical protein